MVSHAEAAVVAPILAMQSWPCGRSRVWDGSGPPSPSCSSQRWSWLQDCSWHRCIHPHGRHRPAGSARRGPAPQHSPGPAARGRMCSTRASPFQGQKLRELFPGVGCFILNMCVCRGAPCSPIGLRGCQSMQNQHTANADCSALYDTN